MSKRTAKFVSALFAGILAGANLAPVTGIHAQAADNCLSAPKGATPAGGHWYYRVDHANKRNCWYLRDESEKSARATTQEASSSAPPESTSASAPINLVPPPKPSPSVRKSVADARAEFTVPPMRVERDAGAGVNVDPRTSAAAPAGVQNNERAAAPEVDAPSSPVASRWPDNSDTSPSPPSDLRVAAADPPASPQEESQPAPQPVAPPVAFAAADTSMQKQSASMQMLFLVMAGALTLAGLTASVIFRFGRARAKHSELRGSERINWDSIDTGHSSPPIFPNEQAPMRRRQAPAHAARNQPAFDDPERRVTELLSRLARSAQN
jgi:hypothetical protein